MKDPTELTAALGEKYLLHPANRVKRKAPFEGLKERDVARHLKKVVARLGGEVRKVAWEGRPHAPDYLVMLPGRSIWVETKRPGESARAGQHREHERLWRAGMRVLVVDSIEAVDAWAEMVR